MEHVDVCSLPGAHTTDDLKSSHRASTFLEVFAAKQEPLLENIMQVLVPGFSPPIVSWTPLPFR